MKEIVVVDIETSGFQPKGGLIVEVGIVSLNLGTRIITDQFNEIVQEDGFAPSSKIQICDMKKC